MKNEANIKHPEVPVGLTVAVLDIKEGYRSFNNVRYINIKSKNYTVLIMRDYIPTVGDIVGDVSICLEDDEIYYKNIRGFYHVSNNNVVLLINPRKEEENAD